MPGWMVGLVVGGSIVGIVLEIYHADRVNRIRNKAARVARRRCGEGW